MSKHLSDRVAGEIRAELARKQITHAVLLTELNNRGIVMGAATLSRRLKGAGALRLDELVAIAEVLGVPLETLLPGVAA